MVSGSLDKTVIIWKKTSPEDPVYCIAQKLEAQNSPIQTVKISPDGSVILSLSKDYSIRLFRKVAD